MVWNPLCWLQVWYITNFNIGIGNLYCDALNANYTHDPHCRRFFPRAASRPVLRARTSAVRPVLLDALSAVGYKLAVLGGQCDR